ncbi:MAG: hypothetical protein KKE30_04150 [Gammaproteobacteria bacterium]|nr:hypothetical protein [Gammaproteobacteria bacterium]MBU1554676.1 hypothetical protein [Gammaproteobacteria bacterium]MBU2070659.1 hypothetical protein [Gammaproteobacteria bacterium]MBU2182141.1 hypothetical protein [Gammaproteobacteria bacterium]MBU2207028.1 hypothetical protein [Gammaproteobacteria bacterium]
MILGEINRWFYLLIVVALLLVEFHFNLDYYTAGPGEEQCVQGYIVRGMSSRSGSVRFRLIDYDVEFESNSINRNVGEQYSIFVDGEFKPNHEINFVCHFTLRSFILFEEEHVFYFGNDRSFALNEKFLSDSASDINSYVFQDFAFYIFLFAMFFVLLFKFILIKKV